MKRAVRLFGLFGLFVAPHVGAWIETSKVILDNLG